MARANDRATSAPITGVNDGREVALNDSRHQIRAMAFNARQSNLAGPPVRYSNAIMGDEKDRRWFDGFIKFRLGHSAGRSYLVPEVLVGVAGSRFFLPSFFGPPIFGFNLEPGHHKVRFNMDAGAPRAASLTRLVVDFSSRDRVRAFSDGAQLYRCRFEGPRQITRSASGLCRPLLDGDFGLKLYHHTTPTSAEKIRASGELWSSPWNLAGTRELKNVAYTYFTSLPHIQSEEDLRRIAMASGGKIELQTTSDRHLEAVLSLEVYRGATRDRTATLPFEVPTALIAPPPLFLHPLTALQAAYYEVVGPEIVRIGVKTGATLPIKTGAVMRAAGDEKAFSYLVLGDASEIEGLAAPYDEEETKSVVHLEPLADQDVFDFWLTHQNEDLVTGRTFEAKAVKPAAESA